MMHILIILIITIGCEFIDSYLGMMYGTILSPVLIIAGYDPKLIVPAILISQTVGGAVASWRHSKLKNAQIFKKDSQDFKTTLLVTSFGVIATLVGAYIGAGIIPKLWLKNYIGTLCVIMGASVLLKISFSFSWGKMMILSLVSAFNKAVSGGGYGPLMSTGQIVVGRDSKNSIVVTDFAEIPICLASFATWVWINKWPATPLIYILPIGAAIGGFLGPIALSKNQSKEKVAKVVGALAFILGIAIIFFEVKG
jgi:uncharacterized membrane protein YfcA